MNPLTSMAVYECWLLVTTRSTAWVRGETMTFMANTRAAARATPKGRSVVAAIALIACCLTSVGAMESPGVGVFLRCAEIEDPQRRVDCYDTAARSVRVEETAPQVDAAPNDPVGPEAARVSSRERDDPSQTVERSPRVPRRAEQPIADGARPAQAEANFGAEDLPKPAAPEDDRPALKSVTAQVKNVREDPRGYAIFTLDNGQVWRQATYGRNPLRGTPQVTLRRTLSGSYYMRATDGNTRSIAVTRVR